MVLSPLLTFQLSSGKLWNALPDSTFFALVFFADFKTEIRGVT